uniref:DNA repair protein complementing XP-C cells homolog n=1 Tax=Dermatophagoides pteronyssinus TaxID=6956 RepID=A0A6P6Y158_DERPT|nr:DNA repair protein complementing XP-C cells homolog [Dermatophagoides pteronyssinus]
MAPVTRSSLKNIENDFGVNKCTVLKKKTPEKKKNKKLIKKIDEDFDAEEIDNDKDDNFDHKDYEIESSSENDEDKMCDSDNDFNVESDEDDEKSNKRIKTKSQTRKKRINQTKNNEKKTPVKMKKNFPINKKLDDDRSNVFMNHDDDNDEDNDDWEEVEDLDIYKNDNDFNLENYNPDIPDKIQISLGDSNERQKKNKSKHWKWVRQCIRVDMNHKRKQNQIHAHQTHLLLSMYRLQYLNSIIQNDLVKALILSSTLFQQLESKSKTNNVEKMLEWFRQHFNISIKKGKKSSENILDEIIKAFESNKITCPLILHLIMVSFLRQIGRKIRLCYLLCPVPIKAMNLLTAKSKFEKNRSEPILGGGMPKISESQCYWLEIFENNKWKSVDFFNEIYDDSFSITNKRKRSITFVSYVFAIDNDGFFADVTQRYCPFWYSRNRVKNRVDEEWLQVTMQPFQRSKTASEIKADQNEFDKMLENVELPRYRTNYKDHPLFALERDLLQYQALYPPNPPPLGFINDEPIYSRDCVQLLKSRERWLRDARTVKLNEMPYKIIKSRLKRKRKSSSMMMDFNGGGCEYIREELELFGHWQTEPYIPPVAKNGIVPRNAYGNVDLYQKCMLPKGTVLLESKPFLVRLATKMNIDCAPAVIGFAFKKHPNRISFGPVIGGYVVCKQYEHKLLDAYEQFRQEQEAKDQAAKEKLIYGNWRRLIRCVIIRHNLKIKYGS